MKIVLRLDVDELGKKGDVIDVSDGYGRNYLIPKGLALKATAGAERQAVAMRRTRELRNAQEKGVAEEMATRLVGKPVVIAARAGEGGRLFGSVTLNDVVRAIEEQTNISLDRKTLVSEDTIKELGTHLVTARPHPEVQFPITVEVIAD